MSLGDRHDTLSARLLGQAQRYGMFFSTAMVR
jgi:hypothetical protein